MLDGKPIVEAAEDVALLAPSANNPRNSEGSFIELKDGTIMYAYSRYTGGDWDDHMPADIAAIYSKDGGKTWSEKPEILIKNKGRKGDNLMSVSLLRLKNGEIAMLYLEKSISADGPLYCLPYIQFSSDECKTWSKPVMCAQPQSKGYYVVNNDRLIQLKSGRLIAPAGFHKGVNRGITQKAILYVFYSDDNGRTWRESDWVLPREQKSRSGFQEPGVIELDDGRLMMWTRTDQGCQYKTFSTDGGATWTTAEPAPEFAGPNAPLSIRRNPADGSLFAVWSNTAPAWGFPKPTKNSWGRTPLVIAVSRDGGKTWQSRTVLESDHTRGFCYTAMHFTPDGSLLLAYCCGGKTLVPLQAVQIKKLKLCK